MMEALLGVIGWVLAAALLVKCWNYKHKLKRKDVIIVRGALRDGGEIDEPLGVFCDDEDALPEEVLQ